MVKLRTNRGPVLLRDKFIATGSGSELQKENAGTHCEMYELGHRAAQRPNGLRTSIAARSTRRYF